MRRALLKREHLKELGFELQAPLIDTREQAWQKRFGQKILVVTFQTRKAHIYYDISLKGFNVIGYTHKIDKWIKYLDEFMPIYEYAQAHLTLDAEYLEEDPDLNIDNCYYPVSLIEKIKAITHDKE